MSPTPVSARPAPITIVPCDWPHSSVRTTPLSDSTVARRVRSANGSRIDGRNRLTARSMCVASRTGNSVVGIRPIVHRGGRRGRQGDATSRSATSGRSSPLRPTGRVGSEAGRLERCSDLVLAVDEDARRQRASRPVAARRGGPGASGTRTPAMRLASTTSKARLAGRQAALAGTDAAAQPVAPGVGERRLDRDRVRVDAERRTRHRACSCGDRQDPRPAADVEDAGAGRAARRPPAARARRGTAGSSDADRSRTPSPDRGRARRRRVRARWRRQVGRITSRRPTRRTGKNAFHASAQSASWTTRVRSSPIGRSPNACRWPERLRDLRRGAPRPRPDRAQARSRGRRPGASDPAARPGPRRRARTPAPPTSRRSPRVRGSR